MKLSSYAVGLFVFALTSFFSNAVSALEKDVQAATEISTTMTSKNSSRFRNSIWQADSKGRLISRSLNGKSITYDYIHGVRSIAYRNTGETITYNRNETNQIDSKKSNFGNSIFWRWTTNGKLNEIESTRGTKITLARDANNKLNSIVVKVIGKSFDLNYILKARAGKRTTLNSLEEDDDIVEPEEDPDYWDALFDALDEIDDWGLDDEDDVMSCTSDLAGLKSKSTSLYNAAANTCPTNRFECQEQICYPAYDEDSDACRQESGVRANVCWARAAERLANCIRSCRRIFPG